MIGRIYFCSETERLYVIEDRIGGMYFANYGNRNYQSIFLGQFMKRFETFTYIGKL